SLKGSSCLSPSCCGERHLTHVCINWQPRPLCTPKLELLAMEQQPSSGMVQIWCTRCSTFPANPQYHPHPRETQVWRLLYDVSGRTARPATAPKYGARVHRG